MSAPITLSKNIETELLGNLKWLAEKLEKLGDLRNDKITASIALRHAIAMDALMLDEMSAKSKILIEKKGGTVTEIRVDRDSVLGFKQNFLDNLSENDKTEDELITVKFDREIVGNLKWVAQKLENLGGLNSNSVRLSIALHHAIAMDALMLDEMSSKSKILIKKESGRTTEIKIDRQSIIKFKENFAV
ncbi:MAG: hypothetical protein M1G31_28815 [Pseudanabaena sp. Salubria-1]|jgi:hypothetical protein|nr:hypothetical protein [Pseudanabaena sp. Salubria-1]